MQLHTEGEDLFIEICKMLDNWEGNISQLPIAAGRSLCN